MTGWKTSQNRKVHQRALNKMVRALNQNIAADSLWRGRFVMRQSYAARLHRYHPLMVVLSMYDKKTGKRYDFFDDSNSLISWNGWRLWEKMNWFITEYCNVWAEDPGPSIDNAPDYTKVPLPDSVNQYGEK